MAHQISRISYRFVLWEAVSKRYIVAPLNSKYFPPNKFWARYATDEIPINSTLFSGGLMVVIIRTRQAAERDTIHYKSFQVHRQVLVDMSALSAKTRENGSHQFQIRDYHHAVPSPRGLSPPKQCSKPPQIETWNTINQLSFVNSLSVKHPRTNPKPSRKNAKSPIENFLAMVLPPRPSMMTGQKVTKSPMFLGITNNKLANLKRSSPARLLFDNLCAQLELLSCNKHDGYPRFFLQQVARAGFKPISSSRAPRQRGSRATLTNQHKFALCIEADCV